MWTIIQRWYHIYYLLQLQLQSITFTVFSIFQTHEIYFTNLHITRIIDTPADVAFSAKWCFESGGGLVGLQPFGTTRVAFPLETPSPAWPCSVREAGRLRGGDLLTKVDSPTSSVNITLIPQLSLLVFATIFFSKTILYIVLFC